MILEKLILGVTLAAPIGPVSVEMIKRGLQNGFLAAFVIRLGGAVGNTLCLVLAYFGLSTIANYPTVMACIGLLGAFFLIYMGLTGLRKRIGDFSHDFEQQNTLFNGLVSGFILALANPVAVVFWLGIFAASMGANVGNPAGVTGFLQNTTIILGVILWGAFLSFILAGGKRFLSLRAINIISILSSLVILGFGLKYSYSLLSQVSTLLSS